MRDLETDTDVQTETSTESDTQELSSDSGSEDGLDTESMTQDPSSDSGSEDSSDSNSGSATETATDSESFKECESADDCALGEECVHDLCVCASGVTCGSAKACCAEGETCYQAEICDDDQCHYFSVCRPVCQGTICGETGNLCCTGDKPECGPAGECVPSCDGLGELCGEGFDTCCLLGQICVFGQCEVLGAPCEAFSECDFGYYCDPGLGRCMPDDFPDDLVCEMDYDFADFEPELLWHWSGVTVNGKLHANVAMTPVVADMTGDGVPDVAVNAYPTGSDAQHLIVVVDGATGETIYYNNTRWARQWSQLALVDITGNGLPEIVMHNNTGVGVIRDIVNCPTPGPSDDCYLWFNSSLGTIESEAQVVADVTANGKVEIIVNNRVLDGLTGEIIVKGSDRGYDYTLAADITGDEKMEFLGTRCLYGVDADNKLVEIWCNEGLPVRAAGGFVFAAVGDVVAADGRQGKPEFVLTGNGQVYFVAGETGELLHQFALLGGGNGGPPVIADFDGDGRAEVGIADKGCYTVYDMDCLGPADQDLPGCTRPTIPPCTRGVDCFEVEACPGLAATGGTGNGILWSVYIQDISSSRTGSSVFDFQGDGRNEVVYNDECKLMVFDGRTGVPQFQVANTTRTASEYPVIVDVNGDSRTNIVVAANNDQFARDCQKPMSTTRPDRYPECFELDPKLRPEWCTKGTAGVFAYQDPQDRWVRTRKIWNQFAYHIDNVTDDARAPTSPAMPWQTHNTFRANRQGEVPLNAADVVVSKVQINAAQCPPDIKIRVTIQNNGVASIPVGLPVTLYDAQSLNPLKTVYLDTAISPGGTIVVALDYELTFDQLNQELYFLVVANDDGTGAPLIFDCHPESAAYSFGPVACMVLM
jgi:hypothetical protein